MLNINRASLYNDRSSLWCTDIRISVVNTNRAAGVDEENKNDNDELEKGESNTLFSGLLDGKIFYYSISKYRPIQNMVAAN